MNRDKLQIPEFIRRYLCRYENFMWNTVPVGHQCGYSYIRLPIFYSRDFLYRNQYLSELIQFLDTDFEDLCPKCGKPLGKETRFEIAFIDLDSKEVFVYSNGSTSKWGWSNEFEENGYKIHLFKTINTLKDKLSLTYNESNKIIKIKKELSDYPKELNIPEFICGFINEIRFGYYFVSQPYYHKCGYEYYINQMPKETIFLYRNWYKEDLNTLLNDEYKFLCPVCGEILSNDIKYYLLFIDLDSKESYIYKEKEHRGSKELDLDFHGYKTYYFESDGDLKAKLIENYKGDAQ